MQVWGLGLGIGEALRKFNGWSLAVFSRNLDLILGLGV
jgi:hypothetical protein